VVRRDGHEFVVEMSMSAVRSRGRYTFNAFLRHHPERKQAERTAAPGRRSSSPPHDAIIATAPSGEITSWNPGARDLYGHRAEQRRWAGR
jgi:PAS domain-containing protein